MDKNLLQIKLAFKYQLLIALFLGALGAFSYAPFHLPYLSYLSFCGFITLIATKSIKQACYIALCWGMGYFLTGVHWVYVSIQEFGGVPSFVACFIVILFVFYLTLYPILFAVIVRLFNRFVSPLSITQFCLLMPITWFATEWLRAHFLNGFAWLQFGYTQLDTVIRNYFPIIGIDGVNFLFSLICGMLAYLLSQTSMQIAQTKNKSSRLPKKNCWILLVILSVIFILPIRLSFYDWVKYENTTAPTISLIQGNISQSTKWDPYFLTQTKNAYLNAILEHSKNNNLIILPEAAIPNMESNESNYFSQIDEIASSNEVGIVVGILTEKNGKTFNSAIGISRDNPYSESSSNRYDKQHLVPFGEYTPLAIIFEPIANYLNIPMSSMSAGNEKQKPIVLNGYKLLVAICYEVILSERYLVNFNSSVNYLVTISNDAWFGDSIAPWQHLQMAQARALEFGRPLLRATNTGITAIIQPNGKIEKMLPQFEANTLSSDIAIFSGETPYSKYGKLGINILLSLSIFLLAINIIKQKKKEIK